MLQKSCKCAWSFPGRHAFASIVLIMSISIELIKTIFVAVGVALLIFQEGV